MDILYPSTWIKILVLPVGRIRTETFREYFSSLSKYSSVIPHSEIVIEALSPSEEKNDFTSSSFKDGIMMFEFCLEHDDEWMALEEFQKYKSILAVIGLFQTEELEASVLEEMYTSFRTHTVAKFQSSLTHKFLVFSQAQLEMDHLPNITFLSLQNDLKIQLKKFMTDLAVTLLKAFRDMSSAIELRSVIHSPPSSVLGFQGETTSDFPLVPPSTFLSVPGLNTSPFPQGNALTSQEGRLKKRASGRAQKLIADLLVLAGNLPSAVLNYLNSIESAKSQGDLLWLASSLDGMYSALLSLKDLQLSSDSAYSEFPEYIKDWLINAGPADIESKYREILHFYERGEALLLVAETGLRLSEYLFQKSSRNPSEIASLLTLSLSRCQSLSHRFQLQFYLKAVMLFEQLNFPRKHAFFLMASVQLMVRILASHGSQVVPIAQFQLMETLARLYGLLSLEHVGWDVLQMEVLDQCILLAEAVEDPSSLTLLIVKCFQRFQKMLSSDGMLEIVTRLHRSSKDAKHLDSTPLRQFSLLKTIQAVPLAPALRPKKSVKTAEKAGVFLYSHFSNESTKTDLFYVSDEPIEFELTLSNPFSFQVSLDSFSILTEGVECVSDRTNLTLSPHGNLIFTMSVIPKSPGKLKVIGCEFKIFGVTEQSVITSTVHRGEVKQKKSFLEIIKTAETLPKLSNIILESEIIHPLALLHLNMPDIYHSRLMLLEGQISKTRLHLQNDSSLPVTYLEITFKESRSCPTYDETNPAEVYFNEFYDLKYTFMRCVSQPLSIAPSESVYLDVELFGKAYCKNMEVLVAYSNTDLFFRQLTYDIATTVEASLVLADFDVTASLDQHNALLHFDFLNQHLVPITITLTSPLATISATLQPNCTKRCMIPIALCSSGEAQLLATVPTLKQKQFILSKQLTNGNELRERMMSFWLKKFILEQVNATWTSYDGCEGILDLSSIHLSPEHIPLLWEHSVTVSLSKFECSSSPNIQLLTLSVKNKATTSQSFLIQFQPDREDIKLLGTCFHTLHLVPTNQSKDLVLTIINPRLEAFLLSCHTTRMGETGNLTSYCEMNIEGSPSEN